MLRNPCSLALIILAVSTTASRADDWPQYQGTHRDGVWHETGTIDKFPDNGPTIRWKVPVHPGYSGPAVVGAKVFHMDRILADGAKNHDERMIPHRPKNGIPGKERVVCFNASDGKELWKHEYDCTYTISYPNGPRCTPTVHDGLVYTLGAEGHLVCFNADDGKVVWQRDFGKDYKAKPPLWGHSAHPLVDGDKLICVVGGDGSVAVAFDRKTGKELWKSLSAREQGYAAPMIYNVHGRRQLMIWDAEAVHGLDPDSGKEIWAIPAPTYQGMSISTPRYVGDSLFVTAYPNTALMIKLAANSSAAVAWKGKKNDAFYSVFSSPVVHDGHLYGVNSGGQLTCIDAATGKRQWESLQAHGSKKPEGSAEIFLVKNGDKWFLANEKGDLIIAKLSPKGYEEVSRHHFLEPTSSAWARPVLWSHPAYADKCAFMRNDKELICVELGKK